MKKEIIDCWPFEYKPRKTQLEALDWLAKNEDAPYIILELPVGAGKSNIGITLSQYLAQPRGNSFILTPQKILQEQYEKSFEDIETVDLASFYGKANYKCQSKNASCEIGDMLKPRCSNCPFQNAKSRAKHAANTVMNYKLALLAFGYTNTFKHKRKLMIFDECHTLENHLVDFDAATVTEGRCNRYNIAFVVQKTLEDAVKWVSETYIPKLKTVCDTLRDEVEAIIETAGGSYTTSEINKIKEYNSVQDHLDELYSIVLMKLDDLKDQYVLVTDARTMSFKRLYGSYTFNRLLKPRADQFLFMSATVLNKDGFCQDLGINPKDAVFLSLPSEFPVENRPVFYLPHMKMNVDWNKPEQKTDRIELLRTIKTLLEAHKDESGIIHTANFQIAKWLVEELDFNVPHNVYHHNPGTSDKRGDVISAFMTDPKPSLLISPSITEGLDLKDDLGRFAIIVKVPFGHLGDQWIKRRMELSREWYQRRALIDIVQGGGRVVRSPTDKGNVYILDGSWGYLMKTTSYMIPKWWKDAYKLL